MVCRSGHCSLLADKILMEMGFANVCSLKTGLRGYNCFEIPLVRREGEEPVLDTKPDRYVAPNVRTDQRLYLKHHRRKIQTVHGLKLVSRRVFELMSFCFGKRNTFTKGSEFPHKISASQSRYFSN